MNVETYDTHEEIGHDHQREDLAHHTESLQLHHGVHRVDIELAREQRAHHVREIVAEQKHLSDAQHDRHDERSKAHAEERLPFREEEGEGLAQRALEHLHWINRFDPGSRGFDQKICTAHSSLPRWMTPVDTYL